MRNDRRVARNGKKAVWNNGVSGMQSINTVINFIDQYSMILTCILFFALGMLFEYLLLLGKKKSDALDRAKLESYVKGMNYIIEDKTDKAIEELTNTAKLNPDLIEIYNSIGNLFRKKGEINRALIIHKSLLARQHLDKEKKIELYINMGVDYRKAGLYDRAREFFKNALSIDPKNSLARKYLDEVYEDSRDWENALIWHKRFGENDENIIAHIYTEIGKEQLSDNNVIQAKKNFEKALKTDKRCVDAHIYLGDAYYAIGDIDKAVGQWTKAAKLRPEFSNLALKRISDVEKLKNVVKELLIDNPKNRYTLYFCANAMFEIGEFSKAISLYKYLIKIGVRTNAMLKRFVEYENEHLPSFINMYTEAGDIKDVNYICTNCGYASSTLFFRCPKCRIWDSAKVDLV